jgi:hypothetical protein
MPRCKERLDEWEPDVNTTRVRGLRLQAGPSSLKVPLRYGVRLARRSCSRCSGMPAAGTSRSHDISDLCVTAVDPVGSRALVRAEIRRVFDYSAKLGRRRHDDIDLFTVLPTAS